MKETIDAFFIFALFILAIIGAYFFKNAICQRYGMEYSILAGQCVTKD